MAAASGIDQRTDISVNSEPSPARVAAVYIRVQHDTIYRHAPPSAPTTRGATGESRKRPCSARYERSQDGRMGSQKGE